MTREKSLLPAAFSGWRLMAKQREKIQIRFTFIYDPICKKNGDMTEKNQPEIWSTGAVVLLLLIVGKSRYIGYFHGRLFDITLRGQEDFCSIPHAI